MNLKESITSVAGMIAVLGVVYLDVIDGVATEVTITAILVVAGLGGYKVVAEYLNARGK